MDTRYRILIVDDSLLMRKIITDIVNAAGHEVIGEASNGKDSIDLYRKLRPDLVAMDIIMPVMDGIAAVKELKKIDPNCLIVMISAMGQQQQVIEAIEAGAKDFIVKPFEPERVVSAIKRIMENR